MFKSIKAIKEIISQLVIYQVMKEKQCSLRDFDLIVEEILRKHGLIK